jgi:hypothetical protein
MAALLRELALEIELLRALEAGIKQARGLEALRRRRIAREPRRLCLELVPIEAKPLEIRLDPRREVVPRALAVGVVEPQQEPPAALAREEPVHQRRARIPEMQPPGGTGREADFGHCC